MMHVFPGITLYPFYRGIIINLSWYLWSSQNTAMLKKFKDNVLIPTLYLDPKSNSEMT